MTVLHTVCRTLTSGRTVNGSVSFRHVDTDNGSLCLIAMKTMIVTSGCE